MTKLFNAFLTISAALLVAVSAIAASTTVTGTVTDTMCGKKHMIAGKTDADCTRECMKSKGNWTYGLIVGDKVYTLSGDNRRFESLAGHRVAVTGEQNGNTIMVKSIAVMR